MTNPGCYATAIALAVAPLVRSGLVSAEGIAITAMSGVSGAGRKASEDFSFVEVADDVRAYRIGKHQHVPEIEQTVARFAGACGPLSFTPVLTPIRRGILATAALRLEAGASAADLQAAVEGAYRDEPFVKVRAAEKVMIKDVVHTNRCHVGVALDARAGLAIAVSAIDNLVKGAAGQAVQAMNATQGWPETTGLDLVGG
ncbi:MAG: Asd/ArgC dimerization domain-containing protein [Anaeromyxobacter sp.]